MGPLFQQGSSSDYHEGKLLVTMRASSPAPDDRFSFAAAVAGPAPTSGMAALSYFERAGLLREVTPISRRRARYAAHMISGPADRSGSFMEVTLAAASGEGLAAATLQGVAAVDGDALELERTALVDLAPGEDLRSLQLALANDPTVASVSQVPIRYLAARANRPQVAATTPAATPPTSLWNLQKIRWSEARALAGYREASQVKVAVLDTGIDDGHPDLRGRVASYVHGDPTLPGASSAQDVIGHGTHVAGTIAALIGNNVGVNGICDCRLHIWKIFDDRPDEVELSDGRRKFVYFVDPKMYLRALLDCIEEGVAVVNLSIGGRGRPSAAEASAFSALLAGGASVVAAMGNERISGSPTSYPAAIPGVIAVGATGINDRVTSFSNRGNHITITAPGDAIWSTLPTYPGQTEWDGARGTDGRWRPARPRQRETDYDAWPGTSIAAPHVTAAIALLRANAGAQSPVAVRRALIEAADKVQEMGGADFHTDYGYGRLNLERLLQAAIAPAAPAEAA